MTLHEAIDHVLTGGNHLALLIGADHPRHTVSHEEALEHYGAGDQYEIWCCWRAIMNLRDATPQRDTVVEAARAVNAATFSHIDGRDLLAELHPRKTLDIKRRKDGVETWFQGDWLSDVYRAILPLRAALRALDTPPCDHDWERVSAVDIDGWRCTKCGGRK